MGGAFSSVTTSGRAYHMHSNSVGIRKGYLSPYGRNPDLFILGRLLKRLNKFRLSIIAFSLLMALCSSCPHDLDPEGHPCTCLGGRPNFVPLRCARQPLPTSCEPRFLALSVSVLFLHFLRCTHACMHVTCVHPPHPSASSRMSYPKQEALQQAAIVPVIRSSLAPHF